MYMNHDSIQGSKREVLTRNQYAYMINTRLTVRVQAAAEKLSTERNLRRLQLTGIQEGSH